MTDRELLELAAKAADMDIEWQPSGWAHNKQNGCQWDPLVYDGDALRLAVKLNMCVTSFTDEQMVGYVKDGEGYNVSEPPGADPLRRHPPRHRSRCCRNREGDAVNNTPPWLNTAPDIKQTAPVDIDDWISDDEAHRAELESIDRSARKAERAILAGFAALLLCFAAVHFWPQLAPYLP